MERSPIDSLICLRPFYSLELNLRGDVSVCCPAWGRWGDENFFTSSERDTFEQLTNIVRDAAEKAKALGVPFDHSTFIDILEGRHMTMVQRNRQKVNDTLKYIFYKAKAFKNSF